MEATKLRGEHKLCKRLGIIDKSRWKKLIIVSDNHGNCVDKVTVTKLFDVMKEFKPDIRIHLGDFLNLNAWRDGASQQEKQDSLADDIREGLEFVEEFKPNVMTLGNHDWRMYKKRMDGNADTREYAQFQIEKCENLLKKLGTKTFAWGVKQGVWEIAGQRFIHGYSAGITATATMGAKFGRCVHGHNHTGDIIWLPTYDGGFAQSCPSLCDNDIMEYQRGQPAAFKHISGFALGIADTKENIYYPGYVTKTKNGFVMMEPKVI